MHGFKNAAKYKIYIPLRLSVVYALFIADDAVQSTCMDATHIHDVRYMSSHVNPVELLETLRRCYEDYSGTAHCALFQNTEGRRLSLCMRYLRSFDDHLVTL